MAASAASAAAYVGDYVFFALMDMGASEGAALLLADAAQWAAGAAISIGASAGLNYLLKPNYSPTPSPTSAQNFAQQSSGRTHMIRSTVANRQIIYGRAMMSGPLVFASTNDNYGTLHMVIALANHECEEIGDVYFGDDALGPLDAGGYPTAGTFFLPTTPGGTLVVMESDAQLVNRTPATQFQYKYVTLPHVPVSITISDSALTTANNPTGTPYFDGGGTWTNVGFDNVAANMRKNNASDAGLGYIPWRQYGVNGNVVKMSASASNGGNINITYTTASGKSYLARVRKHLGSPSQVADAELVALNVGWTNAHRLQGVAYVVTSMVYDKTIYPRGIPNVKCLIKGKKLYDPRTGLTYWNDNPSLAIRDYIKSSYGLACSDAEIDDASFIVAANVCDQLVTLADGSTQKRYTLNGVVDMGQTPRDIMAAMLTTCGGMLVCSGGRYTLRVGSYEAPVGVALTADDLRDTIKVAPRVTRNALFNAVKGTFVDPARGWLPQDYPIQRNATYVANDRGEEIVRDMTFPMTTNVVEAQRLAKAALDRARQGITIEWPGFPKLMGVAVGDRKKVTLAQPGWVDKVFLVTDWSFSETGMIDLVLQEDAAASYDWNFGMATLVDPAPDSTLPSVKYVQVPTGLSVESGTNELLVLADGSVISRMHITWDAVPTGVVSSEARYRRLIDIGWSELPGLLTNSVWAVPVEDKSEYVVQVRNYNSLGFYSDWATISHTVIGKSAPPPDILSLTIAGNVLAWSEVVANDLDGYVFRFHYGINFDWATATPLHTGVISSSPFPLTTQPTGTVTIMGRAIDTSTNVSEKSAAVVTNLGDAPVANVVEILNMHPVFPGVLTGGTVVGGHILANSLDSFYGSDDAQSFYGADTDPFYDATAFDAVVYETAPFRIAQALSGSLATLGVLIAASSLSIEYRISGLSSFFGPDSDSFYGPDLDSFYGVPGPWVPFPGQLTVVNDFYELRVTLGGGVIQGDIAALSLVIDAPDIVEDLADVAISNLGTAIPYTKNFTVIKSVQVTLQTNASGAETVEVDKTTLLAPSVKAFNSSHIPVSGASADITLKGY